MMRRLRGKVQGRVIPPAPDVPETPAARDVAGLTGAVDLPEPASAETWPAASQAIPADAGRTADSVTPEEPRGHGPAPEVAATLSLRPESQSSADDVDAAGPPPATAAPAGPLPHDQVPAAIRAAWPAYFEDAERTDAPFLWALPQLDADLSPFLGSIIPGPQGPTWAGRLKPPIAHFRAIEPEFGGRARIGHLLACVIVIQRREPQNRRARRQFRQITARHGPEAAAAMNLRWLTAVCDSFADTGAEPVDRTLGMTGTLLSNTLKLAETERRMFYPSRRWPPEAAFRRVGLMYDGVIGYWVGQGDMIENLIDRVETVLTVESPAAPFVRELLGRCFAENTVLRRMLQVQDGRRFPLVPEDRQKAIRDAMKGV